MVNTAQTKLQDIINFYKVNLINVVFFRGTYAAIILRTCMLTNPSFLTPLAQAGSAMRVQHIWPQRGSSVESLPVEAVPLAPTEPRFRRYVLQINYTVQFHLT